MKSDLVKKLLRALVTALGIGLGSVLAFVIVQLNAMAGNPAMSIGALLALYAAFALLLGLGGYLIAPRTIDSITRLIALVERCMDKMTFEQQAGSISGLVGGFIIAALLSQLVMLMGASMFTVAMCAILFVVFGVLGVTLGIRRAADFKRMFQRFSPKGSKKVALSHRKIKTAKPKLLDETVLIDAHCCRLPRGISGGDAADFALGGEGIAAPERIGGGDVPNPRRKGTRNAFAARSIGARQARRQRGGRRTRAGAAGGREEAPYGDCDMRRGNEQDGGKGRRSGAEPERPCLRASPYGANGRLAGCAHRQGRA